MKLDWISNIVCFPLFAGIRRDTNINKLIAHDLTEW